MTEETQQRTEIKDFPGVRLEIDEHELSDGSSHEQENASSEDLGLLKSRKGLRVLSFE